jgi:inorganic pyrophosphatase
MNKKGEFLITRRALNKIGWPGMWEIPSGSATVGEESLEAAIREAKEECGLTLLPDNAKLFSTYQRGNAFYDNWLFYQEFNLNDVVLQDDETIDARAASWHVISDMMENSEYIGRDVFCEFDLLKDAEFWLAIDKLVSESHIVIDRPKGSRHPKYTDFIYPVDYGYLENISAMDGGAIDVWKGSDGDYIDAVVCTVDLMKRDSELKILIGCTEEEKRLVLAAHNDSEYMKGILIRRELF